MLYRSLSIQGTVCHCVPYKPHMDYITSAIANRALNKIDPYNILMMNIFLSQTRGGLNLFFEDAEKLQVPLIGGSW